jgi:hypothetical protein
VTVDSSGGDPLSDRDRLHDPNIAPGGGLGGIGGLGILANFAVAKVFIFAVPLLLAAISAPPVYGAIEMAYAVGLMLANLPLLAPLYGISHQYLLGEQKVFQDQAAALVLAVCASSLLTMAMASAAGLSTTVLLTLGMAGAAAIQVTGAFLLRMLDRSYLVAWSDGLTLLAVAVIVAAAARLSSADILRLLVAALVLVSMIACAVAAAILLRSLKQGLKQRLFTAARLGAPMYVYAIFNIWAGASGRVLIGLLSLADVAAYAVAFRIAGAALLSHRLTITVLWSRVYTSPPAAADRLLAVQVIIAAIIAAIVSLSGPWLIDRLDLLATDQRAAAAAAAILPIVALQIFLFAAQSLLQARVNRTGAAGKSLLPMAAITAAGVALIVAAKALGAEIDTLCWLLALYCATFFLGTLAVLARHAMPHPRVAGAGAAGGAVLALIAVF